MSSFLREFRTMPEEEDPDGQLRWVLGNGLEAFADEKIADELIELAQDARYGWARRQIVSSLSKLYRRRPRALGIAISLLSDDTVVYDAIGALRRIKSPEAIPALTRLAEHHDNPEVRKEATKAIAKIEAANHPK